MKKLYVSCVKFAETRGMNYMKTTIDLDMVLCELDECKRVLQNLVKSSQCMQGVYPRDRDWDNFYTDIAAAKFFLEECP